MSSSQLLTMFFTMFYWGYTLLPSAWHLYFL
jgi:hypothetical protein